MTQISDNLYVNVNNVAYAYKLNDKYYITYVTGNTICVTEEIFNSIVGE